MANLFLDIETVPDFDADKYHELSAMERTGILTAKSDKDTYWKLKKGMFSPFDGKVVFIKYQAFDNGTPHELKEWEHGEEGILKKLYGVICDLQQGPNFGMRIIGQNITKFDIPFLYERMIKHNIAERSQLYRRLIKEPLVVDFMLLHLELNKMTAKGLKHDVLAHAYGLETKSTQGGDEIQHYFDKEYDKIIEYSKREFVYPELYSIIERDGIISKEKLEESIAWYNRTHPKV